MNLTGGLERRRFRPGLSVLSAGACLVMLAGCQSDNDLIGYDCSVFPPAASSPYVLPWTVGHTYTALPHASVDNNHKKYAIDILMPIGTPILAIARGEVTALGESFVDSDRTPGHENFIIVDHGDGTALGYGHLTNMGALVEVGDFVEQGDVIGLSGHTGNSTTPHLHFDVVTNCNVRPPVDLNAVNFCPNIPLNFRNANPHNFRLRDGTPPDSCGLRYEVAYTATPY